MDIDTWLGRWNEIPSPTFAALTTLQRATVDVAAARAAFTRDAEALAAGMIAVSAADRGPCSCGVDPLDHLLDHRIDGVMLRDLLEWDEQRRRDETMFGGRFTRPQRAAVSAYWSAELRERVQAGRERERCSVMIDVEIDGW